jgi:hypothetical protein
VPTKGSCWSHSPTLSLALSRGIPATDLSIREKRRTHRSTITATQVAVVAALASGPRELADERGVRRQIMEGSLTCVSHLSGPVGSLAKARALPLLIVRYLNEPVLAGERTSGVRVKPRFEILAPRSLGHATGNEADQILQLFRPHISRTLGRSPSRC